MKTTASKLLLTGCVSIVALAVTLIICICFYKSTDIGENTKVSYVEASFSIDYSNLREVVGSADYVFVGKVVSTGETENDEVLPLPVTEYSVRVEENIKGELITNEDITVFKDGGISDISGNLILFEGDEMPQVGSRYVFYAYAQPDSTLLLSGPVSNVLIDSPNAKTANMNTDYSDNDEYLNALDAYKNEIIDDNERLTCKYDVNA